MILPDPHLLRKMSCPEDLTILGIDPGTIVTGYGLIRLSKGKMSLVDLGCIRPPAKLKLSDRYLIIFDAISELLDKYCPEAVAIETQYVKKNVQSAIKLGMARGVAIVAAKRKNKAVFEYAPSKAKLALTGSGKASKFQMQQMIQRLFALSEPAPEDAADALALALCHGHVCQTAKRFGEEI